MGNGPDRRRRGFTLIELLIVVAILAILAAIALPNLLQARSRSMVARVRADHRTLRLGLEAYRVDANAYPSAESNGTLKWLRWITTPVAYLATVDLPDPFSRGADPHDLKTLRSYPYYRYYGFNERGYVNARSATGELIPVYSPPGHLRLQAYVLMSHGPDQIRTTDEKGWTFLRSDNLFNVDRFVDFIYDPTNGVISTGQIMCLGGEPMGRSEPALRLITASME